MEDMLRDAGLQYAQTLPLSIAGTFALSVLGGWFAYKMWGEDEKSVAIGVGVAVVVLIAAVVLPGWLKARDYCEQVWRERGEFAFAAEKCRPVSNCDDAWSTYASECGLPGVGPGASNLSDLLGDGT